MGKHYSRKELIRIAQQQGWVIDAKRGKGSHVLAIKEGERPFPIPQKIKKGCLEKIKKCLNITE